MGLVSRFAAWRPHNKKGDTIDHSNALKSAFVVCLSHVFSSQEVAIEERPRIGEIDSVLLAIDLPLGFTPVIMSPVYMQLHICATPKKWGCLSAERSAQPHPGSAATVANRAPSPNALPGVSLESYFHAWTGIQGKTVVGE